jgi:signal transduction histidine kinase
MLDIRGCHAVKREIAIMLKIVDLLRRKAEKQLGVKAAVSEIFQAETETFRLLHELQVHHIELEMQNVELILARDAAESDTDKIKILLEQSKVAELVLAENKKLLEKLSSTLERRVREGVLELRKMDNMLLLQNRQAAMGEMISCIAHQWRQPLNILGLNLQHLPISYETGDLDKNFIDKTVENSMLLISHLSKTIDDFRNFFQPDKERVLFEVNKTVESAVTLTRDTLKYNQIKLDIITQENPQISGYPNEYSQVLLNILINAQDALLEHKVENPCITLSSFMENNRAVVTIADNAGGIHEKNLGRIFEPYFTTKGPDQGTGIGLYMAKTIIEKNMHGRLTVCNKNGGAEFRIEV